MKNTLNCRGRILDLSTPIVMGIINLTPDSFFDESRMNNEKSLFERVEKMIIDGASIIDVGGQSTRPRAKRIPPEEEWQRVGQWIPSLTKKFPGTVFSIDTFYSDVAERALDNGVAIVNDISAGTIDEKILLTAANAHVPFIAMHMQGDPSNMQDSPYYDDVLEEVMQFFVQRVRRIRDAGVTDIIIDPGFGFGKTVEQNYTLLRNLSAFKIFDSPILAGLSRKSMITKVLDVKPDDALNGTTVLNTAALLNGASILRVHDVKEAMQTIRLINQLQQVASASDNI